ncbi:MAG: YfhO family protein, partial [Lachnospiraceae bacterium]|nr:YfhO family protein [Lachnospiraceae bacterium]
MFKANIIKYSKCMKDKAYIYALSFLLPLILVLLVYIAKGIYPFGDRAFLRMDLYHQYLPFHAELQYK